jgi:hypothetical protein
LFWCCRFKCVLLPNYCDWLDKLRKTTSLLGLSSSYIDLNLKKECLGISPIGDSIKPQIVSSVLPESEPKTAVYSQVVKNAVFWPKDLLGKSPAHL